MSIKIKAVSCIKGVHFQGKEIQNIDIQAKKQWEQTPHVVFPAFLFPP